MSRPARRIIAAFLALAACAAPRTALNTPASPCFRALPAALAAVRHRGKLVGVRAAPAAKVKHKIGAVSAVRTRSVCLVAFRGRYRPADVQAASSSRSGRFAIVVVSVPKMRVVRTVILDRLPIRFRHRI